MKSVATRAARDRKLLKGDDGAVMLVFAMCASIMVGSMCMALDSIHYEMSQARMQMALDVATLSAGANLAHYNSTTGSSLTQWQADARAYYDANMPKGYLDLNMPDANFSATVSGDPATGQTIKLAASGSVPLMAPIIFGTNASGGGSGSGSGSTPTTQTVSAGNAALRLPKSTLELVMVLDNTGSMGDYASSDKTQGTKIQGLRSAASNLVTNLFNQSGNDSYVGLVPFTTMVNVSGSLLSSGSWLTRTFKYNSTNMSIAPNSAYPGSGWGGCAVEPRDTGNNLYPKAYAPKDVPGFTPFYYNVPPAGFQIATYDSKTNCNQSSTTMVTGVPMSYQSNGSTSTCGSSATIANYWGQVSTKSPSYYSWDQNGSAAYGRPCSIEPVMFLTKDASALKSSIGDMAANGSTIIPTGLLWGWRMLSSAWSNSVSNGNGWVTSDSTLPRPETTQALQRVAIVLTDGQNDPGSASGLMPPPSFNGLTGVGSSALKAPTVTRSDGSSLVNGSTTSVTDINAFQLAVCTAMKNDGVIIYAITFGSDASSGVAQAVMQSCASPGNYYHAPTNSDLNTIFQQIAGNLGVLRLTQ
jgi:Flp pilus assembly protein TadG